MADKILGGVGKLLGIGGKKKTAAAPVATAPQKGPIITQLGSSAAQNAIAIRRRLMTNQTASGLFGQSDKLGG